jgi:hypothetical protein
MNCKKCGSDKIIPDLRIRDHAHGNMDMNLSIYIQKTDHIFFNKPEQGELIAQICCGCGNVELTINNTDGYGKPIKSQKNKGT